MISDHATSLLIETLEARIIHDGAAMKKWQSENIINLASYYEGQITANTSILDLIKRFNHICA